MAELGLTRLRRLAGQLARIALQSDNHAAVRSELWHNKVTVTYNEDNEPRITKLSRRSKDNGS